MDLICSKNVCKNNVLSEPVLQCRYGKDDKSRLVQQDRRDGYIGRFTVSVDDKTGTIR